MILKPDFPYHWKLQRLEQTTGDLNAGMYLIRLWCHCQIVHTGRLRITDAMLAHICRWQQTPADLRVVLDECGFIKQEGEWLVVNDWDDHNHYLVSAWKNGAKGGKPKSYKTKPTGNRPVSRSDKATGYPIASSSSSSSIDKDKKKCSEVEARDFCVSLGLPASDGTAMFLHWEEKGWGKVKDWRLTIRKWKQFGYLPSQKQRKPAGSNGALPECLKFSHPRDWQEAKRITRYLETCKTKHPDYTDKIQERIESLEAQFHLKH